MRSTHIPRRLCLGLLAVTLVTWAGCCHGHGDGSLGGYLPCGAIPAPVGTYSAQWQNAEAAKANADNFVLYQADWVDDSGELGATARRRLARIAKHPEAGVGPFVVEATANAALDEQRRQAVREFLVGQGLQLPDQAVIVGVPAAAGLEGPLAELAGRRLVRDAGPVNQGDGAPFPGLLGTPRSGGNSGLGAY